MYQKECLFCPYHPVFDKKNHPPECMVCNNEMTHLLGGGKQAETSGNWKTEDRSHKMK